MIEIENAKAAVEEIVVPLQEMIDSIVNDYTASLTEVMTEIDESIVCKMERNEDVTLDTLKKEFIKLSSCLFFVASRVENLSLMDSISKIKLKERYDDSFISNDVTGADGKKPTATKLTALAETESRYEAMVNEMYNKAYRIIRSKVDQAQTMVNTLSKLVTATMNELDMTNKQGSNRILNEEF